MIWPSELFVKTHDSRVSFPFDRSEGEYDLNVNLFQRLWTEEGGLHRNPFQQYPLDGRRGKVEIVSQQRVRGYPKSPKIILKEVNDIAVSLKPATDDQPWT